MFYDGISFSHSSWQLNQHEMNKTLQREINLAKNIQSQLLNGKTPTFEGGEVAGTSLPARLIGGDYYDFYPLVNGKIRIVIGDVMGKGIPAAMLMILTRGAFRSAAESTQSPGETLTAMNQALYDDLRNLKSFVTLFCADWDPISGVFSFANAGHNLPLLICGRDRIVKSLPKVSGIMVGGLPNQIYKEESITLSNSDTVFFYTDGIVEAVDKNGEQYQLQRLMTTLTELQDKGVEEIQKGVMDSIHDFTESLPQKDDITMVILKITNEKSDITSFNSPVLTI
ncbi:PP2C family protein-serine/threonine phosphatase [Metabacillus halosaccharovorans]|uniref:PP2C family protein-serine/threonine phosphatase n=1 Tax=Metabacillus halosaccharovorans TaxID=930124 RepID=UPI00203D2635|nr:PP2C family protein-serine/threonine phosphatase [Metabacillus halosaccharovorans]MCM3443392.1 serine/threonine-protein phosphatase [Metabacillus halosaccharovorans]